MYDQICGAVDSTFPEMMAKSHHCPKSRATVIAAGREIVAKSGLYITKKRYAALVVDNEGLEQTSTVQGGK